MTLVGNYRLDGAFLPQGAAAQCADASCVAVRLTLPSPVSSGARTLRVAEVIDDAGHVIDPNPTTATFSAT